MDLLVKKRLRISNCDSGALSVGPLKGGMADHAFMEPALVTFILCSHNSQSILLFLGHSTSIHPNLGFLVFFWESHAPCQGPRWLVQEPAQDPIRAKELLGTVDWGNSETHSLSCHTWMYQWESWGTVLSQRLLGLSHGAGDRECERLCSKVGLQSQVPSTFRLSEPVNPSFLPKPFGIGFSDTCKQESQGNTSIWFSYICVCVPLLLKSSFGARSSFVSSYRPWALGMVLKGWNILSTWKQVEQLWQWMEKPQLVTSSLLLWFLLWNRSEVKVTRSCLTLFDSMDRTVQGIFQARIVEWVAIPLSRGSSQSKDWTQVSHIASRFFTSQARREAQDYWSG